MVQYECDRLSACDCFGLLALRASFLVSLRLASYLCFPSSRIFSFY